MSIAKTIQHTGYIKNISPKGVRVGFISQSACASCHAKGVCTASDMKEKELIISAPQEEYDIGDRVKIFITTGQGNRAVFIGYVLPLLIFLCFLLLFSSFSFFNEVQAGLFSLAVLVPYYGVVYILRNTISRHFNFTIRKED